MEILVPGRGMMETAAIPVDKAVNEYDERLYFERNLDTGQWCVYLKTIPSEPDLPIFGWNEIPHPEDAIKRIYQSDSLRHGEEILEQIDRDNAERTRPYEERTQDAIGEVAEGFEWGFRKMGKHPNPRIFVPKEV